MTEFELIRQYFQRECSDSQWLKLGIGDDAALIQPSPGCQLVICADTLVAGRHFPPGTAPADIGWKALAVNLSDLAAMGAKPRGFLLNLCLPEADERFLAQFAGGLFELADQYQLPLIGGDTTAGPLAISITALGELECGQILRRSAAQLGDILLQVGDLGGAAFALHQPDQASKSACQRLNRPRAFVDAGRYFARCAHAAIDVSDGFAADLNHLLTASGVAARIDLPQLGLHSDLNSLAAETALPLALHGGDDYALLVTLNEAAWTQAKANAPQSLLRDTREIGRITAGEGMILVDAQGRRKQLAPQGYRHF